MRNQCRDCWTGWKCSQEFVLVTCAAAFQIFCRRYCAVALTMERLSSDAAGPREEAYSSLIILSLLLNITTQWHWLLLFVVTVFVDAHFKTLTTVFSLFFLMDCYRIYIHVTSSIDWHLVFNLWKGNAQLCCSESDSEQWIKVLISKVKWHVCNRYPCFTLQLHYADTRVWESWGCISSSGILFLGLVYWFYHVTSTKDDLFLIVPVRLMSVLSVFLLELISLNSCCW